MVQHFENRILRPVRVVTERVTLDGLLNLHLDWRTLDEMNGGRPLLTLSSPLVVSGEMQMGDGPAVVNKSSILFVTEIADLGAALVSSVGSGETTRRDYTVIRLSIGPYDIQGQVFTEGGDTISRLCQPMLPFVALTPATVAGPGWDVCLPFVAINQDHITVAQELFEVSLLREESAAGGSTA